MIEFAVTGFFVNENMSTCSVNKVTWKQYMLFVYFHGSIVIKTLVIVIGIILSNYITNSKIG